MKLSEELSKWRIDRPDEWKMDEFVRNAEKLEAERDALAATVEALRMDDEAIEGLTAWLIEFEQSIDVGCGTVESSAGALVKHLAKLKTPNNNTLQNCG